MHVVFKIYGCKFYQAKEGPVVTRNFEFMAEIVSLASKTCFVGKTRFFSKKYTVTLLFEHFESSMIV